MPAKTEKQRRLFAAAESCKEGKGKCKGAAAKIAHSVSGEKIKEFMHKESQDKVHLMAFINDICNNDFASANNALELAVREKTRSLIRSHKENE